MSMLWAVLVLGVAVPLSWGVVSHYRTATAERRTRLEAAGKALGLTFGVPGERTGTEQRFEGLDGEFDGVTVRIDLVQASQTTRPRDAPPKAPRAPALRKRQGTKMHVYFPTSLALGIPHSVAEGIGAALGDPRKALRSLGDFGLRVMEMPRLLSSSGAMYELHEAGMYNPMVTDERLTLYVDRYRPIVSEATLRPALVAGVAAMRKIYEARWSLPVGEREMAQRHAMERVANRLGLELGPGNLSASGPYRGGTLAIECGFDGLAPSTRLRYVGRALPFQLRIAEDSLRATLLREQDIHVGDDAFDRRFLVQGRPESSVRSVFNEPVRARIFAVWEAAHQLSGSAEVRYENAGFTVRWPGRLSDDQGLVPAARALADATDAMLATQGKAPYR